MARAWSRRGVGDLGGSGSTPQVFGAQEPMEAPGCEVRDGQKVRRSRYPGPGQGRPSWGPVGRRGPRGPALASPPSCVAEVSSNVLSPWLRGTGWVTSGAVSWQKVLFPATAADSPLCPEGQLPGGPQEPHHTLGTLSIPSRPLAFVGWLRNDTPLSSRTTVQMRPSPQSPGPPSRSCPGDHRPSPPSWPCG